MATAAWIKANFPGYVGWNDEAAIVADFNATGGAGKEGGGGGGGGTQTSTDDYINQLIATLTKDVVPKALEFDTEAARKAAEQEWSPYYEEILQDYLTGVATGKARSGEDLSKTLGLLGQRRGEYMGDIARESPLAQEAIGGRAADRGLYFSGGREEEQRLQLEKEQRAKETYDREYQYEVGQKELQQKRYLEDVERERKERERALAREREQAITGQVESQREEKYYGWS